MMPQLHLTADKREIKDFPKLPSSTSFINKMLHGKPKQKGALVAAPKSGTSVSAAGVNAHRELGKPGTMSLRRSQRRGKQRVNPDEIYQRLFTLRLFMNAQASWLHNPEVASG